MIKKALRCAAGLMLLLALLPGAAVCAEYDARTAEEWLNRFAAALPGQRLLNDPQETADPAKGGQVLLEYAFGTVLARTSDSPSAADILEIDLRSPEVEDCLGLRVGATLDAVLGGLSLHEGAAPLDVLRTQEAGIGWSWAYVGDRGVYGVEHVSFGGEGLSMKEYTLTYVIDGGAISAIRMRVSEATQAQAEEEFDTAQEIAQRQAALLLVQENDSEPFEESDLQVMGAQALGAAVDRFVLAMGEPEEVQTLPEGRLLLYGGAAAQLGLNVRTGEEIVLDISVTDGAIDGPRGLRVGMSLQEAAALFACRQAVYASGGMLYLLGEAAGDPPFGEYQPGDGGGTLRYACLRGDGSMGVLEIGIQEDAVAYWHLFDGAREGADAHGG